MSEQPQARCVLGWKSVEELGKTLCHEHLFINAEALHVAAKANHSEESQKPLNDIENLHWLRYFPYSHKLNLHIEALSILVKELEHFKNAGGSTIVDVTISGLRPELKDSSLSYAESLAELSKCTGVNIICGTGFYIDLVHPNFTSEASIEELSNFMENEITKGIMNTNEICAGVIGEIGCSWPLTEREIKVFHNFIIIMKYIIIIFYLFIRF